MGKGTLQFKGDINDDFLLGFLMPGRGTLQFKII